MQTLLIVEDEKMIRKGIAVMASRSETPIDQIIECRNGVEALEILEKQQIDTIFTDIRMPKMDGIEFVQKIKELGYQSDIVVISGYDDFNYAVEMLKQGVFDYILKPVKREKIEELLQLLEEKQRENVIKQKEAVDILHNQMKYFLLSEISEEEWKKKEEQYGDIFDREAYRVLVGAHGQLHCMGGILLENMQGQDVVFLKEKDYIEWLEQEESFGIGVSSFYVLFQDCVKAYEEAKKSRMEAFIRNKRRLVYTSIKQDGKKLEEKEKWKFIEQFVQQFTTKEQEYAIGQLMNLYFEAQHGKVVGKDILMITEQIQKKLVDGYRKMIPEEQKKLLKYENPLLWNCSKEYLEYLQEWFTDFSNCLSEQFINDQSKRKIREAIEYIQKNYQKDLNMAIVSNYVSMNYSLFSIAFKDYTGVNFVNYLKDIRIEAAKELLENTEWKIQDISKKVGYENDKHFLKIFKNLCGVSPTEYRNNFQVSHKD
ncbi:MAG: response regulator [Clostridiales bacterium]|nr:response regulator [Clostridiales bacterium]